MISGSIQGKEILYFSDCKDYKFQEQDCIRYEQRSNKTQRKSSRHTKTGKELCPLTFQNFNHDQVRDYQVNGKGKGMCTARPGWQTISPQNMEYKAKMYPINVCRRVLLLFLNNVSAD